MPAKPHRRFRFKARHLLGAWLAVELLSLPLMVPALAQVVTRVSFKVEPLVVASAINTEEPGLAHFIVTSNSPFSITAANMIGEVDIEVSAQGRFHTFPYGSAAQLPGPETACASLSDPGGQTIYRATRRTAAQPGETSEQSVIMTFRYDPVAKPEFTFTTDTAPIVAGDCAGAANS